MTNQRRARHERLAVVVPTAVRVEADWDRTEPTAADLNRLSRALDRPLDAAAANSSVQLRRLVPEASVVDVCVAQAAEAAILQPATVVTADAGDLTRLAGHLTRRVVIAVI